MHGCAFLGNYSTTARPVPLLKWHCMCRLQAFLAVTEATTWLHNYPCKVLSTYGFLILGIASQLKATQHAMLVLGCQPYAPDYVRLCTVLLEKGGGPGAGVRRHLPCIELN